VLSKPLRFQQSQPEVRREAETWRPVALARGAHGEAPRASQRERDYSLSPPLVPPPCGGRTVRHRAGCRRTCRGCVDRALGGLTRRPGWMRKRRGGGWGGWGRAWPRSRESALGGVISTDSGRKAAETLMAGDSPHGAAEAPPGILCLWVEPVRALRRLARSSTRISPRLARPQTSPTRSPRRYQTSQVAMEWKGHTAACEHTGI
jgi:hypothetical protein